MEPWQRWSMRGTENPENEVRVLGVPPEYMVSVAQMEEPRCTELMNAGLTFPGTDPKTFDEKYSIE